MALSAVDDEQQARLCGRARAKEVFQPMRWKRIGALADENAKLYESAGRHNINSYSLRAVKPLQASLAEVEAVLTDHTALLGRDDTPSLLARLLPATYVSGGRIARYSTLEHSTSERENVALQYARLKPFTVTNQQQETKNSTLLESVDNYVLLGYTLSTKLQRSDTSKKNKGTPRTSASVPSLLHLYRPVSAPTFAERRHDFQTERLATSDFSITYIIQEVASEEEQQKESTVTLEVVLTCSLDPKQDVEQDKEVLRQQKQRLRHDALCLTRLQPFIDAYRQEKTRGSVKEPQHDPKNCDPNMLRGSMFAGGRTCGVCHRKFGPFRWKRHCETCEKVVCNQCLSVLAAAPSLSRRKKRVCSQCLYGETANVAALHKAATGAVLDDGKSSIDSAKVLASPEKSATISVFQFPSLETLVTKHKSSNASSSEATPRVSGRVQIDLGLDPSLASSVSKTPDRRRARSRQSQLSQGSVVSSTSNGSTASSFVAATPDIRRATLSGRADFADVDESAMAKSMRTRRAKTVLLDDPHTKPAAHSHKSLNFITPLSSTAPTHSLYSTEGKQVEVQQPQQEVVKPRASSYRGSKIQFVQLKTPEPDYELDYNWYNIFPKAPVDRSNAAEKARARYVEVSGLKVDARSLVFLRHDSELEGLARCVLEVASQWHGCSINIVGSFEVYCLLTASNQRELDLDDELLELEASPVTVDDVVPREESVSSYAVHHRSPFFVADMEHDPRFRAHPLHTDQGVVSLFSFPIYSSGADTSGSLYSEGEAYCVATLDLWKRDRVPASSHVSNEWISSVGDLLRNISARLEALALESHAFLKPRARAGHSFGSSCDSRGSTRRADSIVDLYDIDSESVVDSPPLSQAETMDRLTNLSYAKVRGLGFTGMGGPGSSTWKYDSDNESNTSSQSASSQSSRFSSHLYSASDMHSTIESLLQQASQTSKYISETGVSI
ncbi:hypothetical protein KRP22_007814 [Phytophthora ramorum]|nr:hypothetical protein KRP22_4174 [Phytophthora ramorum]